MSCCACVVCKCVDEDDIVVFKGCPFDRFKSLRESECHLDVVFVMGGFIFFYVL